VTKTSTAEMFVVDITGQISQLRSLVRTLVFVALVDCCSPSGSVCCWPRGASSPRGRDQ